MGDASHPSRRRAAFTNASSGPFFRVRVSSVSSPLIKDASPPRRILAAMTRMKPGTRVAGFGRNVHSFSSSARRAASAAAAARLRRSMNSTPRAYMPSGPRRAAAGSAASRASQIARDAFVTRGLNVHTRLSFASSVSRKTLIARTYESPGFTGLPEPSSRKKRVGSTTRADTSVAVRSPPPRRSSSAVRAARSRKTLVPFFRRYSTRGSPSFSRACTSAPIARVFLEMRGLNVSSGSRSEGFFFSW